MKREEKKEFNKQLILEAAYEQMTKHGIRETSVQAISERSGLSFVTMYKYFENKEEIAEKVVLKFYQKNLEEMLLVIQNPNLSFKEKLKIFLEKRKEMHEVLSPTAFQDFLEMENSSPIIQEYTAQMKNEIFVLLIRSGKEAGFIKSPAKDASIALFANILLDYLSQNNKNLNEETLHDLENLFLTGIQG